MFEDHEYQLNLSSRYGQLLSSLKCGADMIDEPD